jgi:hypothetical protein
VTAVKGVDPYTSNNNFNNTRPPCFADVTVSTENKKTFQFGQQKKQEKKEENRDGN